MSGDVISNKNVLFNKEYNQEKDQVKRATNISPRCEALISIWYDTCNRMIVIYTYIYLYILTS